MKRYSGLLALFVMLITCVLSSQGHAQLLFEGFNNNTGANELIPAFSSNWHVVRAVTGGQVTDITSASSGEYFMVANGSGNPNSSIGYLAGFAASGSTTTYYGVYETLASPLTIPTGTSITWNMGNSSTGVGVRILVQCGGNWYTTGGAWNINSTSYATGADFAAASTSAVSYSYTFATTGWRAVTLTPGGDFTLEAQPGVSVLPSNDITAIGFFMYGSSSSTFRLDSLTVVPEPNSWALLILAVGVVGCLQRRRHISRG